MLAIYFLARVASIVAFTLVTTRCAFVQHESSVWVLGPFGGVTFQSGSPHKLPPIPNGLGARSTVSVPQGNLLFYTNGAKVWDRRHQVMPNGGNLKATENAMCQI